MNLWRVFPESIVSNNGLLLLPPSAALLYVFVLIALIKFPEVRVKILIFLFVTIITNIIIVATIGPNMGRVLIPLLLLSIMVLPLFWLLNQCRLKNRKTIYIFGIVTLAGWMHSLSWVAWIFALARSWEYRPNKNRRVRFIGSNGQVNWNPAKGYWQVNC